MLSLSDARALLARQLQPLPAQRVALAATRGRILRAPAVAPEDLPAFDRAAMDGYAIAGDTATPRFHIVGEIQPGKPTALSLQPGECARIFTGAPIPAGTTQVLMQEHARVEGDFMLPQQRDAAIHIRRRGEDARRGDVLLPAGTRLGAGELAVLASLGLTQPEVSPAIRVAHFATGNELVAPDQTPAPGQLRDSNSTLVAAFVAQHGGELVRQERCPDDFDQLLAQITPAAAQCDLLLLSGGASVGNYDFGRRLLTALGFQIHFDKLNLRPGKPLIFATRDGQAAFVLPGNPVSHLVTLHVAVRLALEQLAGAAGTWPVALARLDAPLEYRPDPRETFWPARVTLRDGALVAHALRWQSSGDVTGLAGANALLRCTSSTPTLAAGAPVEAWLLQLP